MGNNDVNMSGSDSVTDIALDKIRGCLIGGAAGDALGYAVEFDNLDNIIRRYGKNGITEYHIDNINGKAMISDDTQMTLFTANGLLVRDTREILRGIAGDPCSYVEMAYQDWLNTQQMFTNDSDRTRVSWLLDIPELHSLRAPGNTCLSALRQRRSGECSPDYIGMPINSSKGCGGVMRVAPIALDYRGMSTRVLDIEGAKTAAITHGHPLGYLPAAVLTHIISRALDGNISLRDIVAEAVETVSGIFDVPDMRILSELIERAVSYSENKERDTSNIGRLGEGWVGEEALAIAIYCALKYHDDFSKGIIAAVNHSGDSDSTGAITGNILGAYLGFSKIDDRWKKDLELADIILEIADDLWMVGRPNVCRDPAWQEKYVYMRYKSKKTVLRAVKGDITEITDVDAIVNAANNSLLGGGGVDGAIHRAAGPELLAECRGLNGCKTGEAKLTGAYKLPCEYVIHTVGPIWNGGKSGEDELLASCYESSLRTAQKKGIRKIAFPSISTGVYHFPVSRAAKIAVRTAAEYIEKDPDAFDMIEWVLFDNHTFSVYESEIKRVYEEQGLNI